MTRALVLVLLALAAAPAASAGGPTPYAFQLGAGVLSHDGSERYLAIGSSGGRHTLIESVSTRNGTLHSYTDMLGAWGIPYGIGGVAGDGLSHDGKTLVVADASYAYPHKRSNFAFLDARTLRMRHGVTLKGDFAFDALSPDASRLYLIQHVDANNTARYVVRALDVQTLTLLPGSIADRTQKNWVMQGYPVSRATTSDGRWVYTLYSNPSGFPFVHALDTVHGRAHCVGVPWRGAGAAPYNMRLALHGGTLHIGWASGRRWLVMDTHTWKLSRDRGVGFPWWAWAALAALAATILGAYGRRTRTLAAGTARRDRGSARLGPWLPLTRPR